MIGDLIRSRYELTSLLGEGPIFRIYSAKDRLQGREVSVRLFKPPFDQERAFVAAVGLAIRKGSQINHPGVERLEGVDDNGQMPYAVGQLSPDLTLKDRIKKLAPFSRPVAVQTAISILEGLDAIHSAGLVHGDVSTTNTVISPDGSARLQLACVWEAYSHSQTAGQVVLSEMAPFMAPEVGSGDLPSKRSDVYSVGIILYELVCGRLPYAAETPIAMALKHASVPTPSIKQYSQDAPVVLEEIVRKAMSKDPSLRYADAGEMLSDLRILQDALRFGRSLAWPLRPSDQEASKAEPKKSIPSRPFPKPRNAAKPGEVNPVAPRLNSVRESPAPVMKKERDVPAWLSAAIYLCLGSIATGCVLLYFYFNFTKAHMVTVPNLIGRDEVEAGRSLESMHLHMREVGTKISDSLPPNSIVSTEPKAGDPVPVNGIVNVIVNPGPSTVIVPDLTGLTVDEATTALKNLNLTILKPVSQQASALPQGEICSQDPPAKQSVAKGSSIRAAVSNGQPPASVNPPAAPTATAGTTSGAQGDLGPPAVNTNVDRSHPDQSQDNYYFNLTIKVSGTQVGVELRVDIVDSLGTRTILDEAHDPGDKVDLSTVSPDRDVKFRIYYDGALKKTVNVKGVSQPAGADSSSGGLDSIPGSPSGGNQ